MLTHRIWSRVSSNEKALIEQELRIVPVKMIRVANALGVEVKGAALPAGISGEIKPIKDRENKFQIRVNRHEPKVRQRFTVGHELGHFLLHRKLIKQGLTDDVLYRSRLSDSKEREANIIAAELLMPQHLFLKQLRSVSPEFPEIDDAEEAYLISQLSSIFEVSKDAAKIRIDELRYA